MTANLIYNFGGLIFSLCDIFKKKLIQT